MRLVLFFTGLLMCVQAALANPVGMDFANQMADRINYAERNQGAVWPGFHPAATASIIRTESHGDEIAHAYALNYKPLDLPWQKLESDTNGNAIYFLEDATQLDLEDGRMSKLENQDVYFDAETYNDMTRSENLRNKFMKQRADYYLQNQSHIDRSRIEQIQMHYSMFNKPELVKLMYLEDAALTRSQQSDAAIAEEALRDAVAIRQYRLQLMDKDSQAFENGYEVFLGVPAFISISSRHLSDDDYRKMSQRNGCLPLITLYGTAGITRCVQFDYPVYAATVYGHALDKKIADGAWKPEVETQLKSISHVAMDYYHLSNTEAKTLTEQAMKKGYYQYDRIVREVDFIMTPYLERMAVALKEYEQQPGIEFTLPPELNGVVVGVDGYDSDSFVVDNYTFLYTNVDEQTYLGGVDDKIAFKKIPHIFLIQSSHRNKVDTDDEARVIFKIDPETIITLDSVKETAANLLQAKQQRHFESFTMAGKYTEIQIHASGVLDASSGSRLKLRMELSNIQVESKRK